MVYWIHEEINSEPTSKQSYWPKKRKNKVFGLTTQTSLGSQDGL